MDNTGIEVQGAQPLQPWLRAVDEVQDAQSLAEFLVRPSYHLQTCILGERKPASQDPV